MNDCDKSGTHITSSLEVQSLIESAPDFPCGEGQLAPSEIVTPLHFEGGKDLGESRVSCTS
jgi:hypothetical protein